jgi:hypothetical protein
VLEPKGSEKKGGTVSRYWLKFARLTRPHPLNLGCGVTAWTLDDALHLVRSAFPDLSLGAPIAVMENIDVSTLDPATFYQPWAT